MALSIKDPDADRLARELAAKTGETLTEAIVTSLRERLEREPPLWYVLSAARPPYQSGGSRRPPPSPPHS